MHQLQRFRKVLCSVLVSLVQVCGHNFNAGELGPGTIVGSAAFNVLVIIGLCVSVIPDGQSRKIKHLRVFFITAFWSIFAYIWLYLILAVISPGIVEAGLHSTRCPQLQPRFGSHDQIALLLKLSLKISNADVSLTESKTD